MGTRYERSGRLRLWRSTEVTPLKVSPPDAGGSIRTRTGKRKASETLAGRRVRTPRSSGETSRVETPRLAALKPVTSSKATVRRPETPGREIGRSIEPDDCAAAGRATAPSRRIQAKIRKIRFSFMSVPPREKKLRKPRES